MDSFGAFGELPFGALRDGDAGRSGVVPFLFSEDGYITEPDEDPPNLPFGARVVQALSYSRSLAGNPGGFAGRVADGAGEASLANADGMLDALFANFSIAGRQVRVLSRRFDQAYADAEVIFDGTAASWDSPEGLLRLQLRNSLWRLAVPIQQGAAHFYDGTGGANGGADLAGLPRPLAFGRCREVPAVLVDAAALLYQVHDGAVDSIDAVYDGGDLLVLGVNYTVSLSTGCFTLLGAPVDRITCDLRGSATGGHYVGSTAYIVKRIINDLVGLDAAAVDPQTFDRVEGATTWSSGEVGMWLGPAPALAIDVIERLLVGIGGFLDAEPEGRITAGIFGAPWYGDSFALDETVIESITRVAMPAGTDPPLSRALAAWQPLWTGPQVSGLADIVDASRRSYLAQAFRVAAAVGDQSGAEIMAQQSLTASLFEDAADALAFAEFRIGLYGVPRACYQIRLSRGLWQFRLGQIGRLSYPGWNLGQGRDAIVYAIASSAAEGRVTLGLFV